MSTEQNTTPDTTKEIINKVILTGFLGKDPTLDIVGSKNTKVAKFSLATNTEYKQNGEQKTNTLWHNIVAWGDLAEKVHEQLKRGNRVTIEGRINYKQYTDKNGVKKVYTDIVMSNMVNHSRKEAA